MDEQWHSRLRESRINAKKSIKEGAAIAELSYQGYLAYENGKVLYPRVDVLDRLCQQYQVSLYYVVYGNELGIRLNSSLQNNLSSLLGLYMNRAISVDETELDNASPIKHLYINDNWLGIHLRYFIGLIENKLCLSIEDIKDVLRCIHNVKDCEGSEN